jgi:hypothetical protein
MGNGGYTNLTQFVNQTAWQLFYSNDLGDVIELPLGADGTYLGSNGAAAAPTFSVPEGAGDVLKVGTPVDNQVGVWTGDGTIEGTIGLTYDGSNLQLTGDIGATGARITKVWLTDLEVTNDITIGGTALASTYSPIAGSESIVTVGTIGTGTWEGTAIADGFIPNTITISDLQVELDAGAHTIGFTMQTGSGTGEQTIDWKLGNKMQFTIGAATTFIFTAPTNPCHLFMEIIQDGTGGKDIIWPAAVKWWGTEPTWTDGGIGKTIGVALWYNGTDYWCQGTPWES